MDNRYDDSPDRTYDEAVEAARRERVHASLVLIHQRAHPRPIEGCEECAATPDDDAAARIERLTEAQR